MIILTQQERRLCTLQARIFEASVDCSGDGSAVFVRRFMRSELASRLDYATLAMGNESVSQLVKDVDAEYGGKAYGSEKYPAGEMYWMGYIYRCLCLMKDITSKAAYKLIPARELRLLHHPYHSLGPEQTVERILEAKAGLLPNTSVEYGVAKLREIRERRGEL